MARRCRPDPPQAAQAGHADGVNPHADDSGDHRTGERRARCAGLYDLLKEHRAKLHSTNPIERLVGEIKRRTDVVTFFPNEAAITQLIGAILIEQSDEWPSSDRAT